ncbi:hypothetical protein [Novosphingobium sp.]|uniref:hypothetical protein n=1 Tax=Novosphingobium sp. TaxID=1874826 RepID=UPI0038BB83BF
MIVSANRLRSIGWIALLLVCFALVMVMAFRVNALRSQVHRAEERIVALRQEKIYLETEMETRANQQQLKNWNDVEFGYVAPSSDQYLENERQLAVLSKPDEAGAPAPIRVASMDDSVVAAAAFPAMVSPLTGKSVNAETTDSAAHVDHATATAALGANLGKVRHFADDAADEPTATSSKKGKGGKSGKSDRADKSDKSDKSDRASKADRSTAVASKATTKAKPAGSDAERKRDSAHATKSGEKPRGGASTGALASAKSTAKAKAGAGHDQKLAKAAPHKPDSRGRPESGRPIKIALKDAKLAK